MKRPIQVLNPLDDVVTKLYNKVLNIEQTTNKLGGQILQLGDFVNRSNLSNVVLAYLFSKGIASFQFIRVLALTPKHNISYLKTDKGYVIVEIHEENEMMNVDGKFVDYEEFRQHLRDHLILLREEAMPTFIKDLNEEILRWS